MSYIAYDVALSSDNTKAFVANYNGGLKIFDVSNPASPTLIGSISIPYAYDVALSSDNTKAFVASSGGLKIVDVSAFIDYHQGMFNLPPTIYTSILYVDENSAPDTVVGKLTITQGSSAITSIKLSGDGANNFKAYTNGTIVVANGANLDYETKPSYTLKAVAANSFGDSNIADVYIKLNDLPDTPPKFADFIQYFSVDENSAVETLVGTLIIDNILSAITSIQLSGEGSGKFKVYNNGTIVVAEGADLDYESKNTYSLSVVAKNEFGTSNSGSIIIFLNDVSRFLPSISSWPYWFSVNENSFAGTYVAKATINSYEPVTSVYITGEGSENFNIAPDGTVTVANGAVLDYETKRTYNLQIFASNKYGTSNGANIEISLNNLPDSPPILSNTIINLDKKAQEGDWAGEIYAYSDGSGVEEIHLFGDGSANFDIDTDGSITIAEGANLGYFSDGIHKIYAVASNEFGVSNNALIWLIAGRDTESSPPTFDNITFATFGVKIGKDDSVDEIHPSSIIHCEIEEYISDNDKFRIENLGDMAEIIVNKPISVGTVYTLNFYAKSTCGVSDTASVTIDTKKRITNLELPYDYYKVSLALVDNDTKALINGNEYNSSYVVDIQNNSSSHYVNFNIDNNKYIMPMTAVSHNGKYVYMVVYEYGVSYELNIYDVSSLTNPVLVSSTNIGSMEEYHAKMRLSEDSKKIFLQDYNSMRIIDVSNPYAPSTLGTIPLDDTAGVIMSKDDKTLYMLTRDYADNSVIQRYDVSGVVALKLSSITLPYINAILNISDDNSLIYTIGDYGFAVYDISDTNSPELLSLRNSGDSYFYQEYTNTPISLDNNKALISSGMSEGAAFNIFDFSDPLKMRISVKASYYLNTYYSNFVVNSNNSNAFLPDRGYLLMLDISDFAR
jgi:hypothetical protein